MVIASNQPFRIPERSGSFVYRLAPRWPSVARVELLLRFRDTNVPLALTCVAALGVLLTPPAGANYAVITFGGLKPVMSAGTSIVSAGIVMALLMFPVYLLVLGLGCSRDRRLGTGVVPASSPIGALSLLAGRMVANAILVVLFSLVALPLVIVVTASRFHTTPDLISVAAYLLVVVPAGLLSLPVAAWMDRYLGDSVTVKSTAAITLWLMLMTLSLTTGADAFGLLLLKQNVPGGVSGSEFSVGIIVAEHMEQVPWKTVELTPSFTAARLTLLALTVVMSGLACIIAAPGLMEALTCTPGRSHAGAAAAVIEALDLPRVRPSPIGPLSAAFILCRRWFTGAHCPRALFAAGVVFAVMIPHLPRVAIGAALLIAPSIVNLRRISGETHVRQFELSMAALWRPAPLLFTAAVLAAMTAIPALPVIVTLPPVRGVHVLLAIIGMALWIAWSCAGIGRPLLGISVFTLVWYLECFTDLPPAADLFGLGATSVPSAAVALGLTTVLCVLVLRVDSYGFRSFRNM